MRSATVVAFVIKKTTEQKIDTGVYYKEDGQLSLGLTKFYILRRLDAEKFCNLRIKLVNIYFVYNTCFIHARSIIYVDILND